ncbi:MAG: LPS-assembly protein LptD [Alphaproteobacteria bacterium]|nr:LPS-assembly protein LptD [Alphaproteobacteria bacterium]
MLTGYDEPAAAPAPEETIVETPQVSSAPYAPLTTPTNSPPVEVIAQAQPAPEPEAAWRPTLSSYDDGPARADRASPNQADSSDGPVDLTADDLQYNDQTQVITASGNVMMVQDGRILRADQVQYDLKTDTAKASGHVVLNEINGDIHYSDEVEFNDRLKNGFVEGLKSYMSDGARFTAKHGVRENGDTTIMETASYTPCEACDGEEPFWQIKASDVIHDEEERRISYRNARFEVYGVPVLYTPYFSHPDGTIKRKSGLLGPTAGFRSDVGGFLGNSYYWNIAPDKDATFGLIAATEQAPIGWVDYRQRWQDAQLYLQGGITYAERITRDLNGNRQVHPEELRGHVISNALWNVNDKWRAGFDGEWASDDQYVRRFDFDDFKFSGRDVLESQVYAERFSGRNYAVGRLVAFQDIRIRELQEDQPELLPEVIASFRGEPGAVPVIGGNWSLDTSFLGLRREGNEQDLNRFSIDGGWRRRLVSDYGLLTNVNANIRGDLYNVRDRNVAFTGSGQDDSTSETRLWPDLHVQSSYPLVRQFDTMQASIEPLVALTVSPNIDVNNDIPNEDSRDVQVDALNLFEANRFPGYDRIEDQSKATYGVRTGLYGYDGSRGDIFIGQSYRLEKDDNPFPAGSGLTEQSSDIVGQVSGAYRNKFTLDYRFQLSSDNYSPQRHEIDSFLNLERLQLSNRYLYANALGGTEIAESREQLQASAAYYVSEDWRVRVGAHQDLGQNPGLRRASLGFDYLGQCVSFALTAQRNLTDDASGDSSTEVFFRIGLKNLGEFVESDLRKARASE